MEKGTAMGYKGKEQAPVIKGSPNISDSNHSSINYIKLKSMSILEENRTIAKLMCDFYSKILFQRIFGMMLHLCY